MQPAIRHHLVEGKSILIWLPDVDDPTKFSQVTRRSNDPNFDGIVTAVREGGLDLVRSMVDIKNRVKQLTSGRVTVRDDGVYFDDVRQGGLIVDRILNMANRGAEGALYLMRFMERLSKSPHFHVKAGDLFSFIDACDCPLTEDGCFIGFKFINKDFTDCYTGTIDNSVGATPSMPRNEVDDDRNRDCSYGLHVCSKSYLGSWTRSDGRRLMAVKVAPEDVVCVPLKYDNNKIRTCGYTVIQELEDWDTEIVDPYIVPADTRLVGVVGAAEPVFDTTVAEAAPIPLVSSAPPPLANVPVIEEDFEDEDEDDEDWAEAEDFEAEAQEEAEEESKPDYSQKLNETTREKFVRLLPQLFEGSITLTALAKQFGISRRQAGRIRDQEANKD